MHWVAPTETHSAAASLEKRLWDAADQFRANPGLKAQEYSGPILGLIFLRFAEVRFAAQRARLEKAGSASRRGSRVDEPAAYHADNLLYLAPEARFDFLLKLPEAADIGAKVNAAMREVEKHNPQFTCGQLISVSTGFAVLGAVATGPDPIVRLPRLRVRRRAQPCACASDSGTDLAHGNHRRSTASSIGSNTTSRSSSRRAECGQVRRSRLQPPAPLAAPL